MLTAVGSPPVAASITNTVALSPGYLGATLAQLKDLRGQELRLRLLLPAGALGGIVGGVLLLDTTDRVFRELVPIPPRTGQVVVAMRNIAFNPAVITIRAGQTVVWQNDDTAPPTTTNSSCPGVVYALMPGWDSGTLNPGQSYSHTFAATGIFSY